VPPRHEVNKSCSKKYRETEKDFHQMKEKGRLTIKKEREKKGLLERGKGKWVNMACGGGSRKRGELHPPEGKRMNRKPGSQNQRTGDFGEKTTNRTVIMIKAGSKRC